MWKKRYKGRRKTESWGQERRDVATGKRSVLMWKECENRTEFGAAGLNMSADLGRKKAEWLWNESQPEPLSSLASLRCQIVYEKESIANLLRVPSPLRIGPAGIGHGSFGAVGVLISEKPISTESESIFGLQMQAKRAFSDHR